MAAILVVDDEGGIVESLDALLSELGHEVRGALNGAKALEQLKTFAPDLILLDLMMPILDGPALMEILQAQPATRDIPVVVMTGLVSEELERLKLPATCARLNKPFRAQEMIGAVEAALALSARGATRS